MLLFSSLPVVCDAMKDGRAYRGGGPWDKHVVINTAKLQINADSNLIQMVSCVSDMNQIYMFLFLS